MSKTIEEIALTRLLQNKAASLGMAHAQVNGERITSPKY
jgi:hypothetical protein